ncbi:MAG: UDP-N-acetylmuramate--L-alanine ligase [Bacteroidetes bacterium]|nr:MAG: UDP-N-acetylmuramate--L-alanine ligase [Bacteroidota bacterium]
MIDFRNIEGIYFVGIGGIGMSALALYFAKGGYSIAGYDRSESRITLSLIESNCTVTFEDNVTVLPSLFKNISNKNKVLIVYTPAIPVENCILSYFRNNGYRLYKRSEILGEISVNTDTLAVAGTHGKTTISTMIAHLLKQSHVDCSAFLGGISKNYDSNLLLGESRYTVMEADEFDRSFHRLKPLMAVVTSLDADHLDIYGDQPTMIEAYNEFCGKIRSGGTLVVNSKIRNKIIVPVGVTCFTYGLDTKADYHSFNIDRNKDYYRFSIKTPATVIENLHFAFPGIINIENFTAAIAIALRCGVTENEIRKAVILFQGVRRRFDIRIDKPGLAYIDDYAHHPEEIRACIISVKEYFTGRKITGIFQPHLYSRTRDHADGFASILDELDEVILLPVYPAREKPIEGVSSEMIYNRMKSANKRLLDKSDIPGKLNIKNLDVLLTIGAGDIDTLVGPIEEKLRKERVQ